MQRHGIIEHPPVIMSHNVNILIFRSHYLLLAKPPAPAVAPINLTNASLSFCKTTNLASSITLPSNGGPNPCPPPAPPLFTVALTALFLRCPIPAPDPHTTVQSRMTVLGGTWQLAQILACEPMFAWAWMVASVSIVTAEWMWVPGWMVARGARVTLWEMRVGVPSFPPVPVPGDDCGCDCPGAGGGVGGCPTTHFSLTIHPSPITIGPSNEYSLARG